jgi:hypothetical protein
LCVLSNQNNVNKKKDPESQMGKSEVGWSVRILQRKQV